MAASLSNSNSPLLVDVISDLLTSIEQQAKAIQALLENNHQTLRKLCALAIKDNPNPNLIDFVGKVVTLSKESIQEISAKRQQLESAHSGIRYLYEQLKIAPDVNSLDIEPLLADPLTGTYHRRALNRLLKATTAENEDEHHKIVLVMADLDHLSKVNEEHGQEIGDMVLKHFGHIISITLPDTDYIVRYSEDEFLIIMTSDLSGARHTMERVKERLKRAPLVVPDKNTALYLQFSAGIAPLPHDTQPEGIIKHAVSALHAAKQSGGNCLKIMTLSDIPEET